MNFGFLLPSPAEVIRKINHFIEQNGETGSKTITSKIRELTETKLHAIKKQCRIYKVETRED